MHWCTWGSRYEGGLQKLLQAESAVADMRAELMALQPKLEEAGRQVAATMQVVNEQARAAEAQAEVVGLEETAASEAAAAAKSIKVLAHKPYAFVPPNPIGSRRQNPISSCAASPLPLSTLRPFRLL